MATRTGDSSATRLGAPTSYAAVAEAVWRHVGHRGDGAQVLSSIHVFHDDFATARVDCWSEPSTTILTLFKEMGVWRTVGAISARSSPAGSSEVTTAAGEAADVLRILDTYYQAVEAGDADALSVIFEPQWLMWNHRQSGEVVREDKATFMKRVGGVPLPGYGSDRKIADMQLVHDSLACIRIDKPSSGAVTVFILVKSGSGWRIVEKAWSNGLGE